MTDLMLIKGNDNCWSAKERKETLQRALEFYMEKRRKVKLDSNTVDEETPLKKRIIEKDAITIDDNDDSSSSSEIES
ncbi:Hypothetical predicted protein [Paramuricea clavata]|uniref:Uncharacterized protein n=1 Tax=Paramuricea clavata TaxID=317549 RepID=A0A7D9JT28_PARCT|nr:Hypothetical predicted protein [Paramuricea clavata]